MTYPTYPKWEEIWQDGTPWWHSFDPNNKFVYHLHIHTRETVDRHDIRQRIYRIEIKRIARGRGNPEISDQLIRTSNDLNDWTDTLKMVAEIKEHLMAIFDPEYPVCTKQFPEWEQYWTLRDGDQSWITTDPVTNLVFRVEINQRDPYLVNLWGAQGAIKRSHFATLEMAQETAQSYREHLWSFVVVNVL